MCLNFFNLDKSQNIIMKKYMLLSALVVLMASPAFAASTHTDKERKEDITRHRAMAAAHEGAAKCLESGKKPEVCEKELQAACKGLAVGKYCGMKHAH